MISDRVEWDRENLNALKKYVENLKPEKFKARIPWRGDKLKEFSVYKVPIRLLAFNFKNTRIKSELETYLSEKKKKIDPKSTEQQKLVQQILLDSIWFGEIQTERLRDDLINHGQIDPAVATPDGVLIDGNRRLAIFQTISNNTNIEQFMDVCILDYDSTISDLKALEIRLQMTQPFKVEYGYLNTALEFRNLHKELDWTLDEIAEATRGYYKGKKILNMIRTVDLVDEYLMTIPPPGMFKKHYTKIIKKWEIYANLFSIIKWSEEKDKVDTEIIQRRKLFGFHIIFSDDTTYSDMRRFYHILKEENSKIKLESTSKILNGSYKRKEIDTDLINAEVMILKNAYNIYDEIHGGPVKLARDALLKLNNIIRIKDEKTKNDLKPILKKILEKTDELFDKVK